MFSRNTILHDGVLAFELVGANSGF